MLLYIAMFDRMANRYCTDLIPCDDSDGMIYRLAKRFTFSKYCQFCKPNEIECRVMAKWDSEKNGLEICKRPDSFTLDKCDELYIELAKKLRVENVNEIIFPQVKTEVTHGDFMREIEKQQIQGDVENAE